MNASRGGARAYPFLSKYLLKILRLAGGELYLIIHLFETFKKVIIYYKDG